MYLISNVYLTDIGDVHYTSLAGRQSNQQTHTGFEENSTVVRGHLLSITQGLRKIEDLYGLACFHLVDVLIGDIAIAEEFQTRISDEVVPEGCDSELWDRLIARKPNFKLRFVTSPSESDHLKTIWAWSAVPPQRAELPWIETNPQLI